jgi:formylglycine-generating enzyme required for sulfatase activity
MKTEAKRMLAMLGVAAVAWGGAAYSAAPGDPTKPAPPPDAPMVKPVPVAPKGWTKAVRKVKVATAKEVVEKEITYYKNKQGMEFVCIQAGEFTMGSPKGEVERENVEGPQHKVRITKPFFMAATELTQKQYVAVIGQSPASVLGDKLPVDQVTWEDATAFCAALSKRDGVKYRLPTEAEWEYACRAGTTTAFYTGAAISSDHANFRGTETYAGGPKGVFRNKPLPVGSFPTNPWGLFDMHGNVWEFCSDWARFNIYEYSEKEDPTGPPGGFYRIQRGGSWLTSPGGIRSAYRYWVDVKGPFRSTGFRLVVTAE